jgi:hypothetical protein
MTLVIWNQQRSSGRRTSWAKPFDRIDQAEGKGAFKLGAAHIYLQDGEETELAEGTLVLEVVPRGSVKNGWQEARVYEVTHQGNLEQWFLAYDWRKNYVSLVRDAQDALDRRALADQLETIPVSTRQEDTEPPPDSERRVALRERRPLAQYSTEQLLAELERRGIVRP